MKRGWLVGVVCPKGHRVQRHSGGRITCQACGGRSFADRQLIPLVGKVKRPQRAAYAQGYAVGYEAGCADTVEVMAHAERGREG